MACAGPISVLRSIFNFYSNIVVLRMYFLLVKLSRRSWSGNVTARASVERYLETHSDARVTVPVNTDETLLDTVLH